MCIKLFNHDSYQAYQSQNNTICKFSVKNSYKIKLIQYKLSFGDVWLQFVINNWLIVTTKCKVEWYKCQAINNVLSSQT